MEEINGKEELETIPKELNVNDTNEDNDIIDRKLILVDFDEVCGPVPNLLLSNPSSLQFQVFKRYILMFFMMFFFDKNIIYIGVK